jgi:NAD(P)-dependent dehydrogenase (short-subunit alcohol dehydrogenase family)
MPRSGVLSDSTVFAADDPSKVGAWRASAALGSPLAKMRSGSDAGLQYLGARRAELTSRPLHPRSPHRVGPSPAVRHRPPHDDLRLARADGTYGRFLGKLVARIGRPGISPAYNASKAGIIGLTVAFSAQVADRGVRVNAVMPSLVESRDFGWSAEERAARIREYPLGIGAPSDIGKAVLYLVSSAARWVSGTALQVNGGYAARPVAVRPGA